MGIQRYLRTIEAKEGQPAPYLSREYWQHLLDGDVLEGQNRADFERFLENHFPDGYITLHTLSRKERLQFHRFAGMIDSAMGWDS